MAIRMIDGVAILQPEYPGTGQVLTLEQIRAREIPQLEKEPPVFLSSNLIDFFSNVDLGQMEINNGEVVDVNDRLLFTKDLEGNSFYGISTISNLMLLFELYINLNDLSSQALINRDKNRNSPNYKKIFFAADENILEYFGDAIDKFNLNPYNLSYSNIETVIRDNIEPFEVPISPLQFNFLQRYNQLVQIKEDEFEEMTLYEQEISPESLTYQLWAPIDFLEIARQAVDVESIQKVIEIYPELFLIAILDTNYRDLKRNLEILEISDVRSKIKSARYYIYK